MLRIVATNGAKSINQYKITVWTDNPNKFLTSLDQAQFDDDLILQHLAINYSKEIKVRHYSEIFFYENEYQHTIEKEAIIYLTGLIERDMHGLYKNYPAACDILRFFILLFIGGIYLDVDVSAIATLPKIPTIYLNNNRNTVLNWRVNPIKNMLGNAILAAAPNSWLPNVGLQVMIVKIKTNTDLFDSKPEHFSSTIRIALEVNRYTTTIDKQLDITWHIKRYNPHSLIEKKISDIKDITLATTGPDTTLLLTRIFIVEIYGKVITSRNRLLQQTDLFLERERDIR